MGLYPTGSDELCESIAADVRGAQFACEADPQVMMKKRTKLLSNVNNCLAVMGDDSKDASKILNDALIAEAEACYVAAGLPYHPRGDTYRNLRVDRPDTPRGPELVGEPFGGEQGMRGGEPRQIACDCSGHILTGCLRQQAARRGSRSPVAPVTLNAIS